jgi:hypothetical protein
VITADEFDALFDSFRSTVFRLEALPAYNVGGDEAARLQAFRDGAPLPERSVRTSPWLARIATSTVCDGKRWARTRVVDDPPTEYQEFQLRNGYLESQAAGDEMRIARRGNVGDVGEDFWLFDAGTPHAFAVVMHYDDDGHWLGADKVTDSERLAELDDIRRRVNEHAVPLNVYLAEVMRCG